MVFEAKPCATSTSSSKGCLLFFLRFSALHSLYVSPSFACSSHSLLSSFVAPAISPLQHFFFSFLASSFYIAYRLVCGLTNRSFSSSLRRNTRKKVCLVLSLTVFRYVFELFFHIADTINSQNSVTTAAGPRSRLCRRLVASKCRWSASCFLLPSPSPAP